MLTTYWIVRFYNGGPEIMIISVFIVSLAVFIPGSLMVRSFEYLAEANRMKSEFVSIASHQLRTPMSAIKWSLELLLSEKLDGRLDEKQKEHLNIVEENNNRMIKLVNDLLNVSRIDKHELTLKKERIELIEEIKKNINSLESVADSRNIKLVFESDTKECYIIGDEVYVGVVINNILDNAIKYSKEEGGIVKIKLNQKDGYVRFEAQDRGVGIGEEDKKRIFDKFFRADNARTQRASGTGLGLFIVKSVIKQMKGKVGFSSKLEDGSIFWFEVPIVNH